MFFNFKVFFRVLKLSLTKPPVSLRRIATTVGFISTYPAFVLFNRLGMLADTFFFPGYRKQKITMPLHIMGNPRSGTTFMHNLFLLDERHFCYFTLYDLLIPSLTLRRFFKLLGSMDKTFGGHLTKLVYKLDDRIFKEVSQIHPMGLKRSEEDGLVFVHTFMSPIFMLIPFALEELSYLKVIDRLPEERKKKKNMAFYRGCIQRHLHQHGGDRRILSKNVSLIGSMATVLKSFPETKMIYVIRHPYEAIPSLQSNVYFVWKSATPEFKKDCPEMKRLGKLLCEWLRYAHDFVHQLPKDRVMIVKYEDFIANPKGFVEDVYEWMGLEIHEEFAEKLNKKLDASKKYRSKHQYTLEEFGGSKEDIYHELKDLFEYYGWPVGFEPGAAKTKEERGLKN